VDAGAVWTSLADVGEGVGLVSQVFAKGGGRWGEAGRGAGFGAGEGSSQATGSAGAIDDVDVGPCLSPEAHGFCPGSVVPCRGMGWTSPAGDAQVEAEVPGKSALMAGVGEIVEGAAAGKV
jgi:hypothetical protein